MTTWNSGSLFARKYESDYSAIRRFFVANSNITKQHIATCTNNSFSLYATIELIKVTQSYEYWRKNDWLKREKWGEYTTTRSILKQCPECAAELFHSHIYSFDWCNKCPIHGVELLEHCPKCNKPWPKWVDMIGNECTVCGILRPTSLELRRSQLRKHTDDESGSLEILWSLNKVSFISKILYKDFINHGLDGGIINGDRSFPELEITCFPQYKELLNKIGSPLSNLELKYFKTKPISECNIENLRKVDNSVNYDQNNSIKKIENEIITNSAKFELKSKKKISLPLSYFDLVDDYCPIGLAISIWLSVLSPNKRTARGYSWWIRVFEILNVPYPTYPPLVSLVVPGVINTILEPSEYFKKWMFENHLRTLFIYIYLHIVYLQGILRSPNSSETLNLDCSERFLCGMTYHDFRIHVLSNSTIQLIYKPLPSWEQVFTKKKISTSHYLYYRRLHNDGVFRRNIMLKTLNTFYECVCNESLECNC